MNNRLEFIGIEVSYPPLEVCCYPKYKGKPYFAIKYKEDGQYIVGFGTYNPEVLSRYIKEYFINPKPAYKSITAWQPTLEEEQVNLINKIRYERRKELLHDILGVLILLGPAIIISVITWFTIH